MKLNPTNNLNIIGMDFFYRCYTYVHSLSTCGAESNFVNFDIGPQFSIFFDPGLILASAGAPQL